MIITLPYAAKKRIVMNYIFGISKLGMYWWETNPQFHEYYWLDRRVNENEFVDLAWKNKGQIIIKSLIRG